MSPKMRTSLIFNQIRDGLPSFVMPLSVCMITQDYSSQFVLLPPQPKLLFKGKIGEIGTSRTKTIFTQSYNWEDKDGKWWVDIWLDLIKWFQGIKWSTTHALNECRRLCPAPSSLSLLFSSVGVMTTSGLQIQERGERERERQTDTEAVGHGFCMWVW